MHRHILHLLLFLALVFQGVVALGGVSADHAQEQHCAGHDAPQKDCPCCPDGLAASMSCTAQCSVSQAPIVMFTPVRLVSYSTIVAVDPAEFAGPHYPPIVPPPIG